MTITSRIKLCLLGKSGWRGFFIKLFLASAILLLAYMVYLDSKMQTVFSQMTQAQAIEVQARPLILTPGLPLAEQDLVQELELLGYQPVPSAYRPGQYAVHTGVIEIFLQEGAKAVPALSQQLKVYFNENRVESVKAGLGQQLQAAYFPPLPLAKIWPGKQEERLPVPIAQIPQRLIDLLLWVEDRDFYHHFGVNPTAIARALLVNLQAGRTVQGGSTLTQQLAKNLLLTRERSLVRKINEALLSLLMEWHFSKEQILQAYMNEVYLGQSGSIAIHGFAAASNFYFAKPLHELTLEQQVTLVGMVKGPSLYNPWRRPEKVMERRNLLLQSLMEQEQITTESYLAATSAPLGVQELGRLQERQRPAIAGAIKQELATRADWTLNAGIKSVLTTLDPLSQLAMERAVQQAIPALELKYQAEQLQVAMLAVDSTSGKVRALVSDRSPGFPGYNRVIQAKRSIGSLLKPFILLSALEQPEMTLATQLDDRPVSMRTHQGKRWQPQNFDKQYRGSVPAVDALAKSLNIPFVNLGMRIGLPQVQATLAKLGIKERNTLYPSDLLGSLSLSPWQVAQLYSPLASLGQFQKLHLLQEVESEQGWHELWPPVVEPRIKPELAYQVLYGLQQVAERGTARRLKAGWPDVSFAGKTGTTNDYRDSWFVGLDGRELVVVWVGRDDNQPIHLTGSKAAMAIYEAYQTHRHPVSIAVEVPSMIQQQGFDSTGQAVVEGCPSERQLPIAKGQVTTFYDCDSSEKSDARKSWWQRLF